MKRYDPHMHTAEHVLNQTMVRLFGCERSFSSHLERKKSKCDYHFQRALTPEEETFLDQEVNRHLSLKLPVDELWLEKEEAAELYNLNRLPQAADEKIRIVTIGDYDACPCIGDHVQNTSEVGTFVLGSTSFEEGVLRIRFKLKRN
jgi:Ser-tRNA(Ala) deacylase AlaX